MKPLPVCDIFFKADNDDECLGSPWRFGDVDDDGRDELLIMSRYPRSDDRFYLWQGVGE